MGSLQRGRRGHVSAQVLVGEGREIAGAGSPRRWVAETVGAGGVHAAWAWAGCARLCGPHRPGRGRHRGPRKAGVCAPQPSPSLFQCDHVKPPGAQLERGDRSPPKTDLLRSPDSSPGVPRRGRLPSCVDAPPPQSLLRPVPSHRTSTQTWAWLPPGRMSPSTCGGCSASPRCPECPQPVGAGSHPQPADFPRPRRGWPPQGPCGRRQVGGRRLNTSWREGQARPPPGPLTPRALCARELPPPFLGRQTGERCGSQRLGGPRCGGARPGPQCEGRVDSQLGSRDSPRDGDVVGEVHPGRDGAGQARGRAQRSSLAAGHAPQQPRPAAAGRETGLRLGGRRFLCHVPRTP